jgi:lipopolysaccharide transport system ATP-binding protein
MPGDTVGIIGKNGAGKSTLLKILSKITPPTSGKIIGRGRIASLLEVGTGFHAELSGRENVLMNGSILGMRKSEILKNFDAIVDFSGVEKFIDTPLKHYSSGMQLRLAFAVAAFLENEILIIDEVLAVGDAEFQKKCMGKMGDVSKSGRTILFVSHNMAAVQSLCKKSVFLETGSVKDLGNTDKVIHTYFASLHLGKISQDLSEVSRQGSGIVKFIKYELLNKNNSPVIGVMSGQTFTIRLYYNKVEGQVYVNPNLSIGIDDVLGTRLAYMSNEVSGETLNLNDTNKNYIDVQINNLPLKKGIYSLTLFLTINGELSDWIKADISLDIESGDFYNTGKLPPDEQGAFYLDYHFN